MFWERIESKGLAHYSYLIGDQTQAVVIDPRRDCEVYIERAAQEGASIAFILETHRNEDYITGSVELSARTGARVFHSAHTTLPYRYGEPIADGETVQVGRLTLQALHTPGHTPDHMSYLLCDLGGAPWVVFTGDTLFAGDVGRTDFLGADRLAEMTGLLYDSIWGKLLPLGDGVLVCPAHGAGSVCGSSIAARIPTTIGIERQFNPRLQHDGRDAFVKNVGQILKQSPHFKRCEDWNLNGAPILGALPTPPALSAPAFRQAAQDAQIVDVRPALGFAGAHIPGALSIPTAELPNFAGWLLSYDRPILLVGETGELDTAIRYLIRLGFDDIGGFLADGMHAWHTASLPGQSLDVISLHDFRKQPAAGRWLLDVRSVEEVQANPVPGATNIYVGQVPLHLDQIPQDGPVCVFCGSGARAMIASGYLRSIGRTNVQVILGGPPN